MYMTGQTIWRKKEKNRKGRIVMKNYTQQSGLYTVIGGSAAGITGILISYDRAEHKVTLRIDEDTILITNERNVKERN